MMLAGIRVSPELVRELAEMVDEPTASVLERALEVETVVLALSIEYRERIIRALDDPPEGLAELRGVLLQEHEWRKRVGSFSACEGRRVASVSPPQPPGICGRLRWR